MYAFLSGVVESMDQDSVVLDCHGVGYELYTNSASLQTMAVGKAAKLYAQLIVREDAHTLYGFVQKEDKQMFTRLLSVSGIGPRLALAILSAMSAPQIAMAIIASDERALVRVPGLGKKTAQRLILELKSKMQSEHALIDTNAAFVPATEEPVDDAVAILMAMGFSPQDSAAAVALVRAEGGNAEEMAMKALRRLDRK